MPIIQNGVDITAKPTQKVLKYSAVQVIKEVQIKNEKLLLMIYVPGQTEREFVNFERIIVRKQFPKLLHLSFERWPSFLKGKIIDVRERYPHLKTKRELRETKKKKKEKCLMEIEFPVELDKKIDGRSMMRQLEFIQNSEFGYVAGKRYLRNMSDPVSSGQSKLEGEVNTTRLDGDWPKGLVGEKFIIDINVDGKGKDGKIVIDIKTGRGMITYNSPLSEKNDVKEFLMDQLDKSGVSQGTIGMPKIKDD